MVTKLNCWRRNWKDVLYIFFHGYAICSPICYHGLNIFENILLPQNIQVILNGSVFSVFFNQSIKRQDTVMGLLYNECLSTSIMSLDFLFQLNLIFFLLFISRWDKNNCCSKLSKLIFFNQNGQVKKIVILTENNCHFVNLFSFQLKQFM